MKLLKSENLWIFITGLLIALLGGLYLNFGLKFIFGDALVRSFHAYQVFFGYDPKLSAIGFVWPPLQTMLQVPLALIQPLHTFGFVGNTLSAIFFGVTLIFINKIARFFKLATMFRYVLLVLFASNPLIFFYGINGMSEMIGISFMTMALYYFLTYQSTKNITSLIATSISLALAVMTRWEMAVLAGVVIPLLALMPFINKKHTFRESESSIIIFLLPIIAAIGVWVTICWMITGSPFPGAVQIDNNLGDGVANIVTQKSGLVLFSEGIQKLFLLSPFFLLFVLYSLRNLMGKTRMQLLTILGFGTSLIASQLVLFSLGKTVGELRYFIYIIPITYILVMYLASIWQTTVSKKTLTIGAFTVSALMLISSLFTYHAMSSSVFNNQEHLFINALKNGHNNTVYYNYESENDIAAYLKETITTRNILADDSVAFSIIYLSQKPSLFIQTIDQDFKQTLDNPTGENMKFILISRPNTDGVEDAINKKYPTMFVSGLPSYTLEKDFGDWRLYRRLEPGEVVKPQEVKVVESVKECRYTVIAGDSLWLIAKNELGDATRYTEIIEINETVAAKPSAIATNQQILLPCNN